MTTSRQTLIAAALLAAAAGSFAQGSPTAPATAAVRAEVSRPGVAQGAGMAAEPAVPAAGSARGEAAPAGGAAQRDRGASALPVDPKGDGWSSPMPMVGSGLESVLNSGAPLGRSKVPRKVCPPGLVNRDGNCVAGAEQMLSR